jgi:hypothetical protein
MRRRWFFLVLLALLTGLPALTPAAQKKALSEQDLVRLLAGGVYSARAVALIRDRGICFLPSRHALASLRRAGADQALLQAVINARRVTTQVPQSRRPQTLERPFTSQPAPNPATTGPHNTLNVRTAISNPSEPASVPSPTVQTAKASSASPPSAAVPAGTRITMQNWRQYIHYMPVGMSELFEGHRFWRMPPDIEIVVGPTVTEKLPSGYSEASAKYSRNVQVIHLRNGHNDIRNYLGGEPFPQPQEPDKGYKLLADLWYAYVPHLLAGTSRNPLTICSDTSQGYFSCERFSYVFRQVAYSTDQEASTDESNGKQYWYTEWLSVEEPEELRYTTFLTLYPKNNQRPMELFTFVPSLRRWIRGSLAARCSPISGTDYVEDDFKRVGFNGGLGSFNAQFLQHRQILALTGDYAPLGGIFPNSYYMPLGWPRPSWGNWQLRDVDVIDVRRVPAERAHYCYGKRLIYEDSQTHYALWEDAYDAKMRFWKSALLAQRTVKTPRLGDVPGAFNSTAWDFESPHMTNASTQSENGRDVLVDGEVPAEYRNFASYSTPAGLAEIMK